MLAVTCGFLGYPRPVWRRVGREDRPFDIGPSLIPQLESPCRGCRRRWLIHKAGSPEMGLRDEPESWSERVHLLWVLLNWAERFSGIKTSIRMWRSCMRLLGLWPRKGIGGSFCAVSPMTSTPSLLASRFQKTWDRMMSQTEGVCSAALAVGSRLRRRWSNRTTARPLCECSAPRPSRRDSLRTFVCRSIR